MRSMVRHATSSPPDIRYDLSDRELSGCADSFLRSHPPRAASRYACYRVGGTSPWANMGRTIEGRVFFDSFGDTVETMLQAYGPYESASTFFVSFDVASASPVGALRVVSYSPAGFMTLNDVASGNLCSTSGDPVQVGVAEVCEFHHIDDLSSCLDIGTIAVLPEHRAKGNDGITTSIQLFRAVYLSAIAEDVEHIVSVIDKKLLQSMTLFFGIPFVSLAGTLPLAYLGSAESHAVYCHVPELYGAVDRHYRAIMGSREVPQFEQLMHGTDGMDESLQFFTDAEIADVRWKVKLSSQQPES